MKIVILKALRAAIITTVIIEGFQIIRYWGFLKKTTDSLNDLMGIIVWSLMHFLVSFVVFIILFVVIRKFKKTNSASENNF